MKAFVVHTVNARNQISAQFKKQGTHSTEHNWIILAADHAGSIEHIRGLEFSEVWWTGIGYEVSSEADRAKLSTSGEIEQWQLLYRQMRAMLRVAPMLWIEP